MVEKNSERFHDFEKQTAYQKTKSHKTGGVLKPRTEGGKRGEDNESGGENKNASSEKSPVSVTKR